MQQKIKTSFKTGLERFSVGTSMHGFAELYSAKSLFWKIFWMFITVGACAITIYQLDQSMSQYFSNPTLTVISVVDDTNIHYPPLQLCYWQWYYWVDWEKATTEFSPNQEVLHFAFHYFNAIFTTNVHNLTEAGDTLKKLMKSKNISHMFDLYKSLARPVPILNGDSRNISKYFDNVKIINSNPYYWYCYEVSSEKMMEYFKASNNRTIAFYIKDETHGAVKHILSEDEYNHYLAKWIDRTSMYTIKGSMTDMNMTTTAPPVSIMLDTVIEKAVNILYENDAYTITVHAQAFTWLDKEQKRCQENAVSVANNNSCQFNCWSAYAAHDCNCVYIDEAVNTGHDQPDHVCYKDINFILPNRTVQVVEKKLFQKCHKHQDKLKTEEQCSNECLPACQIWKYEQGVQVTNVANVVRRVGRKNVTKVTIIFPSGSDIVTMTEVNAQSWENFIGNVGGILGIWTGASLVSLVQLIYLCCFAQNEMFSNFTYRNFVNYLKISFAHKNVVNSNGVINHADMVIENSKV